MLNPIFVEDLNTEILKFEVKKKKKKDTIFIDYCRFVVRKRNFFREKKCEAYKVIKREHAGRNEGILWCKITIHVE